MSSMSEYDGPRRSDPLQRRRARESEMRQRVQQGHRQLTAVIDDGLELLARRGAVLELEVGLPAT
jgi:hypothetical protein